MISLEKWPEDFRKLAMRYERLAETFSGLIHIACVLILWRVEIGSAESEESA
jgi:hypothetical protein